MKFSHNPSVGIGIFYVAIKSQILNRNRAVQWLLVAQQPILNFNKYAVYKYILILSKYQSTDFVSPGIFNHQQNVKHTRSCMTISQMLRSTLAVHQSHCRHSQTTLKLFKVLSDAARVFSGAPEYTCTCGGVFKMLQNVTHTRLNNLCDCDLCIDLQELLRPSV